MAAEPILLRLQAEFDNPPEDIRAIAGYLEAGASPAFVSRFRRDETHDPGPERVRAIAERFEFLTAQEARKATLVEKARKHGDDVDALQELLADCVDQDMLDDLDHALRPHEHREASKIAERGLGELVEAVHRHDLGDKTPHEAAAPYADPERGIVSSDDVLAAVVLALAERYGEDPRFRAAVRDDLSRGILCAKAAAPGSEKRGHKRTKRYEEFFDLKEPVRQINAHRMLALRKAEREGLIHVRLRLPEGAELALFRRHFSPDVDPSTPLGQFLDLVYGHSYDHFVHPACEKIVRHEIKEKADRVTVRNFARTLRAQLMAPTMLDVPLMALRASGRSAWLIVLAADGSTRRRETLPIPTGDEREQLLQTLAEIVQTEKPIAVAIPHGRREEQANKLLEAALTRLPEAERPLVIPIDETASVVYATSLSGRRRQPGTETGMRATHSLARRLRDPLHELLRVEPRGLGLGHNLFEVHQGLLNRELDAVLSSCLARIGVDVNRADAGYLARVPGMTKELAKSIVDHRGKHGPFEALEGLRAVDGVDDTAFAHVAGFLRIHGGAEPLDATAVHPEDYDIARQVAALKGVSVPELFGDDHKDVRLDDLTSETIGHKRALGVLRALTAGDRDPRGRHEAFQNAGITSIESLQTDARLRGRITNLTEFGAFVDIGIGQDGLVHVSQIPGHRLRDPDQTLRVGEVITVYVMNVDPKRKKISLAMLKPRHLIEGRQATVGERMKQGRRRAAPEAPKNRAARVPEGRRGGQRRGPQPKFKDGESRERFGGGRGGASRDRGGKPRVITVESERELAETRGHKGELRSLSSLRALLEKQVPKEAQRPEIEDSNDS